MTATLLTQMEKATTIPKNTLHLVEMGDGSGTKVVTQETLVEETGKALKVGNLEELKTENKSSLVAAINEAAQSGGTGGGTSVDILDSKEEIEANTETGKIAGALAVKEMFGALNDNINGNILTYNESEDAYYIQHGADAVPKKLGSLELGTSNVLASGASINYTTTKSYELLIIASASGSIAGGGATLGEHSLTASGFTNIAKMKADGTNAAISERVTLYVAIKTNVPSGTVVTASANGARNALTLIGM